MPIFSNINRFAYVHLDRRTQQVADALARLSTGKKRPEAKDGAALDSVAGVLAFEVKATEGLQQGLQTYNSYASTQSSTLTAIGTILEDMAELAGEALTATSSERTSLQVEYESLLNDITGYAENATFNNIDLFGSNSGFSIRLGIESGSRMVLSAISLISIVGALSGTLLSGTTASNASVALAALSNQTTALNYLQAIAGNHASVLNRRIDIMSSTIANLESAEDAILNIDEALATTEYVNQSLLLEQATTALALAQGLYTSSSSRILSLLTS